MAHRTKIVGFERPADQQFTIVIKCCDDHIQKHTIGSEVLLSLPGFTSLVDTLKWAHEEAAKNHEAVLNGLKILENLKGQIVDHV